MDFKIVKKHKSFLGETCFAEHMSEATRTKMNFSYFMPPSKKPDHALIWLSGLTCTEENFITKAGAQQHLSNRNALVICPDTSPRGLNLPHEHDSYDFGSGAGFYLNALTDRYKDHYNMYDYITQEIVSLTKNFGVDKISLFGHSMGGHGALVIGLREAHLFHSISAFSPICNPTTTPWGRKVFAGYLGEHNINLWKDYDAYELILKGLKRNQILISQGLQDEFLEKQLQVSKLETACTQMDQPLQVNYHQDYDHSYYFISTFIKDHIDFHLSH